MREVVGTCTAAFAAMCAGAGAAAGPMLDINGRTGMSNQAVNVRSADTQLLEARGQLVALAALSIDGSHRSFAAAWARPDLNGVMAVACGMKSARSSEGSADDTGRLGAFYGDGALMTHPVGSGLTTDPTFDGMSRQDGDFAGFDVGGWSNAAAGLSMAPETKPAPGRGGGDIERVDGGGVFSAPLPTGISLGAAGLAMIAGCSSLARWRR